MRFCCHATRNVQNNQFTGWIPKKLKSIDNLKPLTWDTRVRIALGTALTDLYISLHQDTSENLGPGYSAPECTKPAAYSMKSDVYSFGVVMLELLTGRKPYDSLIAVFNFFSTKPRIEQSLVCWAASQLHDIDALAQMVDPALRGLYPPKSLSRFADVISLCIQVKCFLNLPWYTFPFHCTA
ncbi:hypothetical protein GW17_00031957 [Ensete ventricosum]|nr:hypothetical protein GW17_00031957 [Ensete ventricosum]